MQLNNSGVLPLMKIEIITTPNEALKESGFGSLIACNDVLSSLQMMGYNARLSVCKTKGDLADVVKRKPDLVILGVKYIPIRYEDEIWLADYFAQHKINFTGSLREVLKYDSNKVLAKTHLTNKGIKTARYFMATPGQFNNEKELPVAFPLFIKPLDAANGNGIDDLSFVTNFTEYESKVASLFNTFNQPVLAEEYLDGREFTVAIMKVPNEELTLSAIEVIPPISTHGLRILGAQAKKDDSEKLIEIIDDEMKYRVAKLATDAFHALGVRDYGRIDIKTDNHGECFFMEANLVPGMTQGSSYFPKACNIAKGVTYDKVIEQLISGGLARVPISLPPGNKTDPENTLDKVV